ncbi:hypothetical protein EDB85DRAFT_1887490 [Lactarius pseudohatsudake]|nr:hypothetical protein EDB85DRAFT_1887490 [Lactarius pseudohatsudake]
MRCGCRGRRMWGGVACGKRMGGDGRGVCTDDGVRKGFVSDPAMLAAWFAAALRRDSSDTWDTSDEVDDGPHEKKTLRRNTVDDGPARRQDDSGRWSDRMVTRRDQINKHGDGIHEVWRGGDKAGRDKSALPTELPSHGVNQMTNKLGVSLIQTGAGHRANQMI